MISSGVDGLAGAIWDDYCHRFTYSSRGDLRDGCHPLKMEHGGRAEKSVVLIHGLTDSPYFMTAVGDYFYTRLGYNVYLPLLQGHGLKDPHGMRGVSLETWMDNVAFSVETAGKKSESVSVGGLSTGGALSLHQAMTDARINGAVYLFSGALVIGTRLSQIFNPLKDLILRSHITDFLDDRCSHIGDNPYRYSRINFRGVWQLRRLQIQIDDLLAAYSGDNPLAIKIFAAHSRRDVLAGIQGLEALKNKCRPENFSFFPLGKTYGVPHASVVLEKEVRGYSGRMLEPANPLFSQMMAAVADFQR